MHGRDTTMEREFDIVLQMTLEHALTERLEQSNKWTVKVTNINKYVLMIQIQGIPLEDCFS